MKNWKNSRQVRNTLISVEIDTSKHFIQANVWNTWLNLSCHASMILQKTRKENKSPNYCSPKFEHSNSLSGDLKSPEHVAREQDT